MKRVVVGMSGGVDSSVGAYLLQQEGYEVIGMFMKNWHDDSVTISDECPWLEDSHDAMMVAQSLGIPFQAIDLSKDYKARIVDYMFDEYQAGRTPNPDVLCNREIKFDIFLEAAMKLNADFIATGHYCQKSSLEKAGKTIYQLKAGKDGNKDQSYFLCQLTQDQLSKALFPIGHLNKPEVRDIAHKMGLITADKKDSQGLCFVGKVRLPDFLQQKLAPKKGQVIEVPATADRYKISVPAGVIPELTELAQPFVHEPEDGKVVGEHNGAHYFTIGQRKGLNIGGTPEPLFVLETDTEKNIIYTGQGDQHPGLFRRALKIEPKDIHWLRTDLAMHEGESRTYQVRIRYRQELQQAELHQQSYFAWIIPALVFLTIAGLAYISFLRYLPRNLRNLFIVSAIIYVSGAIGMEMVGGAAMSGEIEIAYYRVAMPIEEVLEMFGVVLFIHGLISVIVSKTNYSVAI